MFEFHGWAVLQINDHDDAYTEILVERKAAAIKLVQTAIDEANDDFSLFEIRPTSNDLTVLIAHGLRNHRFIPVIELFRRIAEALPYAYGLLYIHDDEDAQCDSQFTVYRIARGRLDCFDDSLLSPRIPTVEKLYEF